MDKSAKEQQDYDFLSRVNIFCPISMKNSNNWKNFVGNRSIVHIPTAHSDDITDSTVSLPVYNIAGRQLFPQGTQPKYD